MSFASLTSFILACLIGVLVCVTCLVMLVSLVDTAWVIGVIVLVWFWFFLRLDLRRVHTRFLLLVDCLPATWLTAGASHPILLIVVFCLRLGLRRAHYTLILLIVVLVLVVADVNDFGTPVCFGGAHYTLVRYLSLPTWMKLARGSLHPVSSILWGRLVGMFVRVLVLVVVVRVGLFVRGLVLVFVWVLCSSGLKW